MALLVLGAKVGDVVDVADGWIRVLSVDSNYRATLACSDSRKLIVRSRRLTSLMADVWVGLGPDPAYSKLRLMFQAPRHVPIVRRRA